LIAKPIAEEKYAYFYNKIYDQEHQMQGVECVLREKNRQEEWHLPQNIDQLPFFILQNSLTDGLGVMNRSGFKVIIKLTLQQFLSREFKKKIALSVKELQPYQLVIEMSHDEIANNKKSLKKISRRMKRCKEYGILFSINNLGADFHFAKNVHKLLPLVNMLKLDMRYFKDKQRWLDLTINFWIKLAKKYQLELVISGVETMEDEQLVNQLQVNLRQGYLYGVPQQKIVE
jgi:FOG: EAL domain